MSILPMRAYARRDRRAPGSMSNGWVRLSTDSGASMWQFLGGYKGVVAWEVIEKTWAEAWWKHGRTDGGELPPVTPCRINCRQLARETGLSHQKLSAAKRQLVKDGFLIEHTDGTVEPNQDYKQYAGIKGNPKIIAWCESKQDAMARLRARLEDEERAADVLAYQSGQGPDDQSCPPNGGQPCPPNGVQGCTPNGGQPAQDCTPKGVQGCDPNGGQPCPPNGGQNATASSFSLEELNSREGGEFAPPSACARETENTINSSEVKGSVRIEAPGDPAPAAAPRTPVRVLHPTTGAVIPPGTPAPPRLTRAMQATAAALAAGDFEPGPVTPDDEMLMRIQAKLSAWFPNGHGDAWLGIQYKRHAVPTAWFLRALKRLAISGKYKDICWALLWKVVGRWVRAGGPDVRGDEEYYDDDLNEIPYSRRTNLRPRTAAGANQYAASSPPPDAPENPQFAAMREYFARCKPPVPRYAPGVHPADPKLSAALDQVRRRIVERESRGGGPGAAS